MPFELLPSNHMVVEAKLNGKGPYRLIFDLGAPVTLLSNRAATATDAIPKNAPRSLMMGTRGEGKIDRWTMGELESREVPIIVMDHPAVKALGEVLGKPLDGIVGYTFWARYRTTIDYQAKEMRFQPVDFQVRDLMQDLPSRLSGPKVRKTIVLAPTALWGLELAEPNEGLASRGVPIREVRRGSAADSAGMKAGDLLVSIDGRWTTNLNDAYEAAQTIKPDQTIQVVILREGVTMSLSVTPREGL